MVSSLLICLVTFKPGPGVIVAHWIQFIMMGEWEGRPQVMLLAVDLVVDQAC